MLCFGVHQPESLLVKGSQSVEQLIRNEKVGGSIPLSGYLRGVMCASS